MLRTTILGLVGSWAVTDCGQRKALGGVAEHMLNVIAVTAHLNGMPQAHYERARHVLQRCIAD